MPKYNVNISRTYIHGTTIEVEADTKEKAEAIALESIGNFVLPIRTFDEEQDYAEVEEEIEEEKEHIIDDTCPKCGETGDLIDSDMSGDSYGIQIFRCSSKKCKTKWEVEWSLVPTSKTITKKSKIYG